MRKGNGAPQFDFTIFIANLITWVVFLDFVSFSASFFQWKAFLMSWRTPTFSLIIRSYLDVNCGPPSGLNCFGSEKHFCNDCIRWRVLGFRVEMEYNRPSGTKSNGTSSKFMNGRRCVIIGSLHCDVWPWWQILHDWIVDVIISGLYTVEFVFWSSRHLNNTWAT